MTMEIHYLGDQCFRIKFKETHVIFNPNSEKLTADIVVYTQAATCVLKSAPKRPEVFTIEAPGEYEVMGVSVFAYRLPDHQLACLLAGDDLLVAYTPSASQSLPEEMFDQIDEIDLLLTPSLNAPAVHQGDPKGIVLPADSARADEAVDKLIFQSGKLPVERQVFYLHVRN